jgi:hypothetical protein
MGKYLAGFAAFYLGMVMLKDGTLGTVVGNAARTVESGIKGIKPITQVG